MSEIGPISNPAEGLTAQMERVSTKCGQRRASTPPTEAGGDRVELSESAVDYDRQAEAARAVEQRISDIRARIADGTYLTPDKIDFAVERLYEELVSK